MFKFKNNQRNIFFVLIVFALILSLLIGFYFFNSNSQKSETVPPDDLLSQVGRLIVLPTGEDPTIATVTDLTELKQQEFFSRASIGDKVIIYAEAGKAILYSPTEDKIIEMAPINKNIVQ